MSEDRRFDEPEIAEILEKATADEPGRGAAPRPGARGLTLSQLQEIGAEVGIAPARIAEAARAVSSREASGVPRRFFGAPASVKRVVPIARALDEDEWARLVADVRETFGATGRVSVHGSLRSWRNGNLQVHVEPHGDAYRVRMQTVKSAATRSSPGGAFVLVGAVLMLLSAVGVADAEVLAPAVAFAAAGVGQLAWVRATLPGWAAERAAQMEGLAERIPRLLKGDPMDIAGS